MLDAEEAKAIRDRLAEKRYTTRPRLSPEDREALVREYLGSPGITLLALARKWGVTPQTIRYHLDRACR